MCESVEDWLKKSGKLPPAVQKRRSKASTKADSEPLDVRKTAKEVADYYYANWKREWVRDGNFIRCYARVENGRERGRQLYSFEISRFRTVADLEQWLWTLKEKTWIEKWDLATLVTLFKEASS